MDIIGGYMLQYLSLKHGILYFAKYLILLKLQNTLINLSVTNRFRMATLSLLRVKMNVLKIYLILPNIGLLQWAQNKYINLNTDMLLPL